MSYWSIVRTLRLEQNMSFRDISNYLVKYHRFQVSYSIIYKTWNEIELKKEVIIERIIMAEDWYDGFIKWQMQQESIVEFAELNEVIVDKRVYIVTCNITLDGKRLYTCQIS